jgi:hypothetical protein
VSSKKQSIPLTGAWAVASCTRGRDITILSLVTRAGAGIQSMSGDLSSTLSTVSLYAIRETCITRSKHEELLDLRPHISIHQVHLVSLASTSACTVIAPCLQRAICTFENALFKPGYLYCFGDSFLTPAHLSHLTTFCQTRHPTRNPERWRKLLGSVKRHLEGLDAKQILTSGQSVATLRTIVYTWQYW